MLESMRPAYTAAKEAVPRPSSAFIELCRFAAPYKKTINNIRIGGSKIKPRRQCIFVMSHPCFLKFIKIK